MDQFTYLADPNASLRLANQGYQDEIKRATWRQAQATECRQRAMRAGQEVRDEITSRPALSWRGRWSLRSLLHHSDGAAG